MHRWLICVGMMSMELSALGGAVSGHWGNKVTSRLERRDRDLEHQMEASILWIKRSLPRSEREKLKQALERVQINDYDPKVDKTILVQGPGYEHRIIERSDPKRGKLYYEKRISINGREINIQTMGPQDDEFYVSKITIELEGPKANKPRIKSRQVSTMGASRVVSSEAEELMEIHWKGRTIRLDSGGRASSGTRYLFGFSDQD